MPCKAMNLTPLQKFLTPLVVLAAALLTPGASAQDAALDTTANSVTGLDLRDYVSADLPLEEQAFMRTYINTLPAEIKQRIIGQAVDSVSFAVVDGSTGAIHYSRSEEMGSYELVSPAKLPGEEHPLVTGATKNPGVFGGSGPYRRIYTVPLPASPTPKPNEQTWYEQQGVVTAGCAAGDFAKGDQGYAYMGGWSATWDSAGAPSTVDAGLVYNLEASEFSDDDYSMFMNIGGKVGIISKGNATNVAGGPLHPQPTHIKCYDPGLARIDFAAFPTNALRNVEPECWTGTKTQANFTGFPLQQCSTFGLYLSVASEHFKTFTGGHTAYIIYVSPSVTAGGWAHLLKYTLPYWNGKRNVLGYSASVTCGGCIFKWMTSIAQSKGNTLTDGSHYSATWSERKISGYATGAGYTNSGSDLLVPLSSKITDCSEYPLWHPPYSSNYQADCTDTPAGVTGDALTVQVKDYDAEGETDTISATY